MGNFRQLALEVCLTKHMTRALQLYSRVVKTIAVFDRSKELLMRCFFSMPGRGTAANIVSLCLFYHQKRRRAYILQQEYV